MESLADALTGSPVRPRSLGPLLLAHMFCAESDGQSLEEERQRLQRVAVRQATREATSRGARVAAWFGAPPGDLLAAGGEVGGDAAAGAVTPAGAGDGAAAESSAAATACAGCSSVGEASRTAPTTCAGSGPEEVAMPDDASAMQIGADDADGGATTGARRGGRHRPRAQPGQEAASSHAREHQELPCAPTVMLDQGRSRSPLSLRLARQRGPASAAALREVDASIGLPPVSPKWENARWDAREVMAQSLEKELEVEAGWGPGEKWLEVSFDIACHRVVQVVRSVMGRAAREAYIGSTADPAWRWRGGWYLTAGVGRGRPDGWAFLAGHHEEWRHMIVVGSWPDALCGRMEARMIDYVKTAFPDTVSNIATDARGLSIRSYGYSYVYVCYEVR